MEISLEWLEVIHYCFFYEYISFVSAILLKLFSNKFFLPDHIMHIPFYFELVGRMFTQKRIKNTCNITKILDFTFFTILTASLTIIF